MKQTCASPMENTTTEASHTKRVAIFWTALVAFVFVCRLPALIWEIQNIDETDFFLMGKELLLGGDSYVSFVEKKPPLVFWTYALFIALGAENLRLVHLLTNFWVLLGSFAAWLTAKMLDGDFRVRAFSALTFAGFSSGVVLATDCETLSNLPSMLAILAFVYALRKRRYFQALIFTSGVMSALAALYKQPAGATGAAIALHLVLCQQFDKKEKTLGFFSFLGGVALPITMIVIGFALNGNLDEMVEWTWSRNLSYRSSAATVLPLREGLLGFLQFLAFVVPFFVLVTGILVSRVAKGVLKFSSVEGFALSLFFLSLIAVLVQRQFYWHYYVQFAPSFALLAIVVGKHGFARFFPMPRIVVVLLFVLPMLGGFVKHWVRAGILHNLLTQDEVSISIARFLESHCHENERVYMWGHFNPVYYLSRTMPASRYYYSSPIIGDFDPRPVPLGFDFTPFINEHDASILVSDLLQTKPRFIIDSSTGNLHDFGKFPLEKVKTVYDFVQTHYKVFGKVAGATVYMRKDLFAANPEGVKGASPPE